MIELMVVCIVIVIISVIAIPNIAQINASYKLDAAGRAVASLVQQARLQAVKNNLPAYVQYDTTQTPNLTYVNANPALAYAVGNPDVALSAGVTFQVAGMDHTQLDNYLGGNGVVIEPMTNNIRSISFNARGLPCVPTGNPQVCNPSDGGAPPAFLWLMRNPTNGWEAVTVTPAGRIKAWRLVDSTAKATASCGFAACWQ
jgi:Tfp pilus assembly protein FimT